MDPAKERHILGLDLVRFGAAAMVMALHYGGRKTGAFTSFGWVGVEVFFVLSGYVIAYSSEDSTPAKFANARVIRLLPGVAICATAAFVAAIITGAYPDPLHRYLLSLVLWPFGPWLDTVYWTLPVEVAFYALVWLVLLRRPGDAASKVAWAIGIASSIYWFWRLAAQYDHRLRAILLPSDTVATFTMLSYGCYFAIGALLRDMFRTGVSGPRVGLLTACLLAGGAQIAFASPSPVRADKMVAILIWIALVGAIPLAVRFNNGAWRYLGRQAPAIRWLGLATYPLYLLHDTVFAVFGHGLGGWMTAALAVAISLGVARWGERPSQGALRRVLSRLSGTRRAFAADRAVNG